MENQIGKLKITGSLLISYVLTTACGGTPEPTIVDLTQIVEQTPTLEYLSQSPLIYCHDSAGEDQYPTGIVTLIFAINSQGEPVYKPEYYKGSSQFITNPDGSLPPIETQGGNYINTGLEENELTLPDGQTINLAGCLVDEKEYDNLHLFFDSLPTAIPNRQGSINSFTNTKTKNPLPKNYMQGIRGESLRHFKVSKPIKTY